MSKRASKQADRNASRKASKRQDEDDGPSVPTSGSLVDLAKTLVLGSCMAQIAPQLGDLLTKADTAVAAPAAAPPQGEGEAAEPAEANDGGAADAQPESAASGSAAELFDVLGNRLAWHNCLGLAAPRTAEESRAAWLAMKSLEFDGGPKKKKGNPGVDRIVASLHRNLPQYLHMLLALLALRALLFRSFFACLPWLLGYQFLSLVVPLQPIDKLPGVPLDKVDVKYRIAGTMAVHALLWLFFLYEMLWRIYFYEKILYVGILLYHAYAVRPAEA